MEERFFNSISDEQQTAAAENMRRLKRDALERSVSDSGKTREDIKGSYARRLADRLREKA